MKVTNYEISKKLAEIGFKAEHEDVHVVDVRNKMDRLVAKDYYDLYDYGVWYSKPIPAYDLETLMDVLPAFIDKEDEEYHFWLWNDGMGYYSNYDKYSGENAYNMDNGIFEFSGGESLADAAARLLIALHEKGLVKFEDKRNN